MAPSNLAVRAMVGGGDGGVCPTLLGLRQLGTKPFGSLPFHYCRGSLASLWVLATPPNLGGWS